ncbi:MAG: transposase, partial [Nanoarchaeota archaeon]
YDIEIKHFLGIPIEDTSFDYSTISVFRKRLGAVRFERIFQKMLEQIKQKGILDDYKTQIIDSMPVLSKAALPSTTALIYSSIKQCVKLLPEEKKKEILNLLEIDDKKLEHYSKARPLFKLEDEEKKKAFGKSVKRAVSLIEQIKDLEETKEEVSFLKQIIQDNAIFEDELVREADKKPPKSVKTLVDRDAKLGHKSKDEILFGYKHNASITENGFITATTTTTMADKDDEQFAPIINKQIEVSLKAEKMKGDSAYGYPYSFIEADAMGIELEAPLRKGKCEDGFNWYDFSLSNDGNCLTCPNGITVGSSGKNKFIFPVRACTKCSLKQKCTTSRTNRTVIIPEEHEFLRKVMEKQKTRVKTGKSRLFIENIFAFLEKLGGKISPYFNIQSTTIHNVLVATLSNLIKCVRLKG